MSDKTPKRRADRPKKRKFAGNRYTGVLNVKNPRLDTESDNMVRGAGQQEQAASKVKLQKKTVSHTIEDEDITGYRFVDIELLIKFVGQFCCPSCGSQSFGYANNTALMDVNEAKCGLASVLKFTCADCKESTELKTSVKHQNGFFDVNRRFPFAVYSIGRHYTQGKRFLSNMNMPQPQTLTSWKKHTHRIHTATKETAIANMKV